MLHEALPKTLICVRLPVSLLFLAVLASGCPHGTRPVADLPSKSAAAVQAGQVLVALRLRDGPLEIAHGQRVWELPVKPEVSDFDGLIQELNGLERGGVSIAADRAVLYGAVTALLDALKVAGFHRITFVTHP